MVPVAVAVLPSVAPYTLTGLVGISIQANQDPEADVFREALPPLRTDQVAPLNSLRRRGIWSVSRNPRKAHLQSQRFALITLFVLALCIEGLHCPHATQWTVRALSVVLGAPIAVHDLRFDDRVEDFSR